MTSNAVATTDSAVTPMQMLQIAVSQNADLDKLTKLMDLQERWEKNESRKAYQQAFAAFKAEAVTIVKNVVITDGPLRGKTYADLYGVVQAATSMLSKHGLTTTWKIIKNDKDWIEAECTLTHVSGHSESASFGGPPDSGGAKNAMQARASTLSYIERYTFLAVTGLAAGGTDDDGNMGRKDVGSGVTPERRKEIQENIVSQMKEHIRAGSIDDAVIEMENGGLDGADEWAFAWTFFDSKERSAMKKASERMKVERKSQPITDAQRKRLEAMIGEKKMNRDSVKAEVFERWGREHFADLTRDEYDQLCSELETEPAPPQNPTSASRGAGNPPATNSADGAAPLSAEKAIENISKATDAESLALAADLAISACSKAVDKAAASVAYRKRLAELKAMADEVDQ